MIFKYCNTQPYQEIKGCSVCVSLSMKRCLERTSMIETVKLNVIIILVIPKATQACSVVRRSDFAAMF